MDGKRAFPEGDGSGQSFPIEPTGTLLPGGTCLELIQDPNTRQPRILVCTSLSRTVADCYEFDGCVYRPPRISSSLARAVPLPTHCESYESTQALFASVRNAFSTSGISEEASCKAAHFVLATWFPALVPVPPCLIISGPPTEAAFFLQVLGCLVWRGFPVRSLSSHISTVVEQLHPTLLVDARYLTREGRRLLAVSSGPRSYIVRRNAVVNVAVGKAIYWGHQADPDFPIDFAVHVHIAPSQGMPCFLDE
jgi:hypothetical protein